MIGEGIDKVAEIVVSIRRQIGGGAVLGTCPIGHQAQASDHRQPLAVGVVHHQVRMGPVVDAGQRLQVGPGEVLHNPGGAHLTHHLQGALDLTRLHFIGETGVDPHLGIHSGHCLLRSQRHAGRRHRHREDQYTDQQHNQQRNVPRQFHKGHYKLADGDDKVVWRWKIGWLGDWLIGKLVDL